MFCGYATVLRKHRIYSVWNPTAIRLEHGAGPEYLIPRAVKILSGKELIHHTTHPDWRPSDVALLIY
jgi:hypothetical protein